MNDWDAAQERDKMFRDKRDPAKDSVVYGVLCWFNPHNRAWDPYTPEQLTVKFKGVEAKYKKELTSSIQKNIKIIQMENKIYDLEISLDELESQLQEMDQ